MNVDEASGIGCLYWCNRSQEKEEEAVGSSTEGVYKAAEAASIRDGEFGYRLLEEGFVGCRSWKGLFVAAADSGLEVIGKLARRLVGCSRALGDS